MLLERDLEHLNRMLLEMAEIVQDNINRSFYTFKNNSKKIYINDDLVDHYELLIEETCLNILIKEQLFAKDLRKVLGILKMVSDLERIGDHADDIMKYYEKLQGLENSQKDTLESILNIALKMVDDSITSFVNQDVNLAFEVINQDDAVDNKFEELIMYLINENNCGNLSAMFVIYTTIVVKYIERIADHAVNIAEWTIYIISGIHKTNKQR